MNVSCVPRWWRNDVAPKSIKRTSKFLSTRMFSSLMSPWARFCYRPQPVRAAVSARCANGVGEREHTHTHTEAGGRHSFASGADLALEVCNGRQHLRKDLAGRGLGQATVQVNAIKQVARVCTPH